MTNDPFERDLRAWLELDAANLRIPPSLRVDIATIAGGAWPIPRQGVTHLKPRLRLWLPWPEGGTLTKRQMGWPLSAAAVLVIAILGIASLLALNLLSSAPVPAVGASPSVRPVGSPQPKRVSRSLDGVAFSVDIPNNWEDWWSDTSPNYIAASSVGGQAAEAQISWTGYPVSGPFAMLCSYLRELHPEATVRAFADAVASVPGTELVSRTDVTVGGHPATNVVFVVRDDVGCDPGFFFSYENTNGGALWPETKPGDTVRVWVVEDGPRLLVIEGKTSERDGSLEPQIQAIIDSITFD